MVVSEKINNCSKHKNANLIKVGNQTGTSCEGCIKEKREFNKNQFISKSIIKHKRKYDYSKVEYVRVDSKVIIICPIHGDFLQCPGNHSRGQGCDTCLNKSLTLPQKEILKKFKNEHGTIYDYSKVEYINYKTNVTIICKKHGEFSQTPNKHIGGQGCPKCKMSHGERKIEFFLIENKIEFVNQKTYSDCVVTGTKSRLKFDFYLPKSNTLIEYDGEQHFAPRYFGMKIKSESIAQERFERVKFLDKLKNEYVKKNNLKLIRISYKKLKTIEKELSLLLLK